MKTIFIISIAVCVTATLSSCKKEKNVSPNYATNGETIFRTGKNKQGDVLQDIDKSAMKMAHSCVSCHGSNGNGNGMMKNTPSIRYSDLTNPLLHKIPYTDELLERFIDHELKSDGTIANTGVVWKMNSQEKQDIINYLKQL
jgi:cytochrome c553